MMIDLELMVNSQIEFKTTKTKSSLCDYSNAYILMQETITITGASSDAAAMRKGETGTDKIFKNWVPFLDCISEINNTHVENAKDLDVVMSICNVIEHSKN